MLKLCTVQGNKKKVSSQILKSLLTIKTKNRCNYVPSRRFGRYSFQQAVLLWVIFFKFSWISGIPGFDGVVENADHCIELAKEIGYPVMVKASAGGGGKGMRVAYNEAEAREAFQVWKKHFIFAVQRMFSRIPYSAFSRNFQPIFFVVVLSKQTIISG